MATLIFASVSAGGMRPQQFAAAAVGASEFESPAFGQLSSVGRIVSAATASAAESSVIYRHCISVTAAVQTMARCQIALSSPRHCLFLFFLLVFNLFLRRLLLLLPLNHSSAVAVDDASPKQQH